MKRIFYVTYIYTVAGEVGGGGGGGEECDFSRIHAKSQNTGPNWSPLILKHLLHHEKCIYNIMYNVLLLKKIPSQNTFQNQNVNLFFKNNYGTDGACYLV